MKIEKTPFDDLWIVQPTVLDDPRGYFFEVFNQEQFKQETNLNIHFVQDNESMSSRGVLRGLHFQIPPMSQAKWVRVSQGAVHDVVVDLRRTKRTFGKSFQIVLKTNRFEAIRLVIPKGLEVCRDHKVDGPITFHCLNGRIAFTAGGETRELPAGHWLFLEGGVPHTVHGLEDAVVLLTVMFI